MGTMKGVLIRFLLVGVGGFFVVWRANYLLVPHFHVDPLRAMKESTTSAKAATTSSHGTRMRCRTVKRTGYRPRVTNAPTR